MIFVGLKRPPKPAIRIFVHEMVCRYLNDYGILVIRASGYPYNESGAGYNRGKPDRRDMTVLETEPSDDELAGVLRAHPQRHPALARLRADTHRGT